MWRSFRNRPKLRSFVTKSSEPVIECVPRGPVDRLHTGAAFVPHHQFTRQIFLNGEQPLGIEAVVRQVHYAEAAAAQL